MYSKKLNVVSVIFRKMFRTNYTHTIDMNIVVKGFRVLDIPLGIGEATHSFYIKEHSDRCNALSKCWVLYHF